MAASTSTLLHVRRNLIIAPTSANTPGATGSYGGTLLGTVQELRLIKIPRWDSLRAEEYGGEKVDSMHLGWDVELTGRLRTWDADVLADYLPNSVAKGGSGVVRQLFETGTSLVPGQWMSGFSSVLMAAPNDPNHPGLLIYNAVPFYLGPLELTMSAYDDLSLEVRWMCLRDASNRVYRHASMADLQTAFP